MSVVIALGRAIHRCIWISIDCWFCSSVQSDCCITTAAAGQRAEAAAAEEEEEEEEACLLTQYRSDRFRNLLRYLIPKALPTEFRANS
jgi:hypothetical protein